ncbi:P-loop containing nucleoside triphosphate hydrolase protein [Trichoderma pleuroticola]
MNCSPSFDNVFGPAVALCRRHFDFTILFEESMLSLLPSSIFLIIGCLHLRTKIHETRKTEINWLYFSKQLLIAVCFALEVALLVEYCHPDTFRTRCTVAAAIISVVVVLPVMALSHAEHTTSVKPSAILTIYLSISVILDAVRIRTLWLSMQETRVSILFTTATGIKLAILIVENIPKLLLPTVDKGISPEELSGIFSLSLFTWILPIMKLGFRKTLAIDDLDAIDEEMASEYLGHKTQREWDRVTVETLGKLRKGTLIWIISKTLSTSIFVPVLPRLFLTGFTFSQPFLVNRMIRYLQNSHEESLSTGYGLLGAYALVYIGIAIATGWYQRLTNRWIIMTRGSLITLIYNKTLTMSSTEDERLSMSLMSNDVQRIIAGLRPLHETWACTLEAGLAIWLLELQIRWATVGVVVVFLTCTGLTLLVSKYIGERQRVWIQASQKRVNATANMLGWIKEIKMLGLESRFRSILESFRDQELKVSKTYRHLTLMSIVLSYSTSILSPIVVFAIYTTIANRDHESLDTSRMFTTLTLISLLGTPLITLFQSLPSLRSALSCFQRIQVFVECAPRDDYRVLVQPEPLRNPSSSILASHEKSSDIASTFASANPDTDAIVIDDASFAWFQGKVAILRSISLRVAHGKLLMVVGPVGSGKSLLMKAMLGEVKILKGCISLSDQIGYCDQTPWLRNTSVRQNIIAALPFDEAWYSTVLHACAIDTDIERFTHGDLHAVGSGGINLSGGQKQRIALARAIYARRRLLILDDVFSGIDIETEGLIFHRLWGSNGLLRRLQATVVLATHATHRLRYSDQIFVLSAEGVPLEQGTFDELIASNGYIASLYSGLESNGQDSQELEGNTTAYNTKEKNNMVVAGRPMNDAKHGESHQAKDRAIYAYYYKAIGAMHSSIFAMTAVAFGVFLKVPDVWVTLWSNAEAKAPNQGTGYWLGIYSMFQILAILSLATSIWFTTSSGKRLHTRLLNSVLGSPFSFISAVEVGVLVNRFSQDMLLVDNTLPYDLFNTATEMVTCIVQLAIMAISSVYIIAIYPLILLLLYFLQRFYLHTSKQLRVMELEAKSPLYEQFLETISGICSVRAFSYQSAFRTQNDQLLDDSQRPLYTLWALQAWLGVVLDLTVAGLALIVVGLAIGLRDRVHSASIGVALLNLTSLGETIKNVLTEWTSLENSMGAISRLESFNRETPSEDLAGEVQQPPANWPSVGHVEFEAVKASYRQDLNLALDDISLSIEAGQKIAVCGPSGSGKSSIVVALLGMLELSQGSISIDGIDLSTISRHEIRSRLSSVTQEPCYFPGTFRLNLDPANSISEERVSAILHKLELWAKIQQQGGLDAQLCFDAFSHGQKQLFCLARAILKSSKILILDEATSSVDKETAETMERVVAEECQEHTIIAIIHRLESIKYYDRIIKLDNGKLTAEGT